MKVITIAALALSLVGTSASAADMGSVTGSTALALAAVVAIHSPDFSSADKATVAALFDGETGKAGSGKIAVAADKIMCRTSNVDLTARSCELTFRGGKRSFKGRQANELFATLAQAGITAEGAAGSNIASASKLTCTLDVAAIKQKDGGGASCAFDPND